MKQIEDATELKKGDIYIGYFSTVKKRKKWVLYSFLYNIENRIYGTRLITNPTLNSYWFKIGSTGNLFIERSRVYKFKDLNEAKDYIFVEEL